MNLDNVKNVWQQQNSGIGPAIKINQEMLSALKVNEQIKTLRNMQWARIIESVLFFIIIVSLWQYIVQDFTVSAAKVSAFILNVFAIIGFAGSIGQIVLISKVDYSNPVSELQKDIYRMCAHKLQLTKLLLMSVPFYLTYVFIGFDIMFDVDLFQHLQQHMIWVYSLTSGLLLIATVWFLGKLHYKNIATLWVKKAIHFIVGERLVSLAQFINNIEMTDS